MKLRPVSIAATVAASLPALACLVLLGVAYLNQVGVGLLFWQPDPAGVGPDWLGAAAVVSILLLPLLGVGAFSTTMYMLVLEEIESRGSWVRRAWSVVQRVLIFAIGGFGFFYLLGAMAWMFD